MNNPAFCTFDEWFAENKESEALREEYNQHKLEIEQMGFQAGSFEIFAKNYYEQEIFSK
jgi:hypothetical protein